MTDQPTPVSFNAPDDEDLTGLPVPNVDFDLIGTVIDHTLEDNHDGDR